MKRLFPLGLAAALTIASGALAVAADDPASVEWLLPGAPMPSPQSDDAKQRGMNVGRDLPELELLQPALDPDLAPYRKRDGAHLAGSFKGAASDVLPGLTKAWVDAFEALYPSVHIAIDPPYAGSLGATELAGGKLDFVFVSRELRPTDVTAFQNAFGFAPLSVPVSGGSYRHFGFLDSIAFIVNKVNPIEHVSFEKLDAAFSKTRARGGAPVTTWGDLGLTGDWAKKPIHLIGVEPWNGFEEFVRQRVLSVPGTRGEWNDGVAFAKTVFPISKSVADDPYALAYDGLAYLRDVKVLSVGATDSGPFYSPTYENVALATYPLSRLTYFNVARAPGKALDPVLAEFLRFILSRDGQAVVQRQNLLLPLRAAQVRASLALVGP